MHFMMAAMMKVPEIAIAEEEAREMAKAIARTMRHYPTVAQKVGDKAIDHVNLLMVLGGVYGTRFAAFKMRSAAEKATNVTNSNVSPFPNGARG